MLEGFKTGIGKFKQFFLNGTEVTATAAELNKLDNCTATAAELSIMHGVTATATEINNLDGLTRGSIIVGGEDNVTSKLDAKTSVKSLSEMVQT